MPEPDAPVPDAERRLTLGEHLEELRSCAIRGLIGFAVALLICLFLQDSLVYVALWPHLRTMAAIGNSTAQITVLTYTESFSSYLSVVMIAALFLSAPWLLFQLWTFIRAGLYRHERGYVARYIPATCGLFLVGILFGYFVLIPIALRFLIAYGGSLVSPQITLQEYLSFFFLLTFAVGVTFELPLFMVFFVQIGMIRAERYAEFRRHAILLAFIVGAVFTPPDPISQTLLAVPLYVLFEVGLFACRRLEKARNERQDRAAASAP